jgi:hypothetical protein
MRLHIFGASGSGVTTTGQALAARMNLPYFDSDDYYHIMSDPERRSSSCAGTSHKKSGSGISLHNCGSPPRGARAWPLQTFAIICHNFHNIA